VFARHRAIEVIWTDVPDPHAPQAGWPLPRHGTACRALLSVVSDTLFA